VHQGSPRQPGRAGRCHSGTDERRSLGRRRGSRFARPDDQNGGRPRSALDRASGSTSRSLTANDRDAGPPADDSIISRPSSASDSRFRPRGSLLAAIGRASKHTLTAEAGPGLQLVSGMDELGEPRSQPPQTAALPGVMERHRRPRRRFRLPSIGATLQARLLQAWSSSTRAAPRWANPGLASGFQLASRCWCDEPALRGRRAARLRRPAAPVPAPRRWPRPFPARSRSVGRLGPTHGAR